MFPTHKMRTFVQYKYIREINLLRVISDARQKAVNSNEFKT